jgi:hypothetical protein
VLAALLCLDPALADAEPKTLRDRLLHTAARIVRGQRKRKIKIPETWPWAAALAAAFHTAFALPAPPRGTPPARGTGAPDATVASTHTTHTPNEDHKRR